MTIKRRISLSNKLMIILPMLLTLVTGGVLSAVIMGTTGIEPHPINYDRIVFEDMEAAKENIDSCEYILVADGASVYRTRSERYVVVLSGESGETPRLPALRRYYVSFVFVSFLLMVVYLTNRALTRYVFMGIVAPIETLANGVHEIRDGNLSYRIDYRNRDEFAAICTDFNEMARRLSDMVGQRQKEETNRRELIAGISHDLRTPLTSVKAYLEGIETGVAASPSMQKKYLEIIKNKTSDLEYIINQLFLFSKLDVGEFPFCAETVDIGRELGGFAESHAKEYREKGLSIKLSGNAKNLFVETDVVLFRNVIINILENSVKYNDNEHAEVGINYFADGGEIKIVLTDNGPGIPEESLAKLFDVFYKSDAARRGSDKGSGLGLAISKKIVERSGGAIVAENAPGGGLAIIITLPLSNGEVAHE